MTEPENESDQERQAETTRTEGRDMGLRTHLREIAGSTISMSTVFLVLLILIVIGGGCALLLR